MQVGIIGVNHKSADLELREKFAKAALRQIEQGVHERLSHLLLTTCNRTEIYFSSDDLAASHTYLLNLFRLELQIDFEHKVYSYFGFDCFQHLACVTAGIDSALVGETEIQGQVKQCYQEACLKRALAPELHFLFQKSLKIGKEIRTLTRDTPLLPTLEEVIFSILECQLEELANKKILFVGISDINLKIFKKFKKCGLAHIAFCNRNYKKALQLKFTEEVTVLPWEKKEEALDFDLLIYGTKSPDYLLEKVPPGKRKVILDLSVPRNVHPHVGRASHVTLLNIDQINEVVDQKRRKKALEGARFQTQFITQAVARQIDLFESRETLQPLLLSSR